MALTGITPQFERDQSEGDKYNPILAAYTGAG